MKRNSLLRFLLVMVVASAPLAMAQTRTAAAISYRITGILVSSADGAPLARGHLTVTLVPRGADGEGDQFPAPLGTFDADERGHFSIPLPSAGMWRVVGSARGYVTQAYDEHEFFSSGIVLTAASPVADLRFQLPPESVITGKVIDEAGEAVRNARVSLLTIPPPGPDSNQPAARARASTSTDDRGFYEFDGLQPGDYRIKVQAQVWYALAAQQNASNAESDGHPLDPSLDVTYPLTWYPGSSDPSEAETVTLHAGDSRQADLQLTPIPSVHLHIVPEGNADANGRRIQAYPMIERISAEGNDFVPVSAHIGPQGTIDIGGLAPGQYEIRMQGPGEAVKPAIVNLAEGSAQTLDMSAATTMASVSIHLDGLAGADADSVRVNFIDPENGRNVARDNAAYFLSGSLLQRRRQDASGRTIEIPPGRYEVVLAGRPNLFLTRITAQSAQATGRFVTVPSGSSTLTLHIADGRSALTGIAKMQGKPSVGAMVLLIPATLGEPDNLNIIRRDQTNTDGSFELNNVLPGQYILLAIDQGWQINWKDPSTLRGYMMHGIPVDLTSTQKLRETIEAQAP
jgi:hypothetical protein